MKHYAGLDLHSNNTVIVIINEEEERVLKRKVSNDLSLIVELLSPFKESLEGVVVESTYNWYWLVDGLMESGFKVHLAHPGHIEGPRGKKHTNDYDDSFHLAHLLRMNNLPQGYIYPKASRGLRDLLRKRSILVRKRTSFVLSLGSLYNRYTGVYMEGKQLEKLTVAQLQEIFKDETTYISARSSLQCIKFLNTQISQVEKIVLMVHQSDPYYQRLQTVHGIGKILALTISLETGDIRRFAHRGDFVSYCRGTGSRQTSNGKKKGEKNRKSGNAYLAWAFVEAANFSIGKCPYAKAFYEKKRKQSKLNVVATKALASKLARACYYIMKNDVDYDVNRIFNNIKIKTDKGCGSKPKKGTGSKAKRLNG
ncbi:MAG: IS110 family transposase [Pseudomonadales bacterium]|nr:IS110 family transposase [Pseudomonadales bacterium]